MEIYQQIIEKGRKINELDDALVQIISNIVQENKENNAESGQEVIISFEIRCIPEYLRDLFKERLKLISARGEIFNHVALEERKYFCYKEIEMKDDRITAKLIKNWK